MTEENAILNFNDAINALSDASDSFKIDVWVPLLERYLTFKEIDAKQQKSLLSAAIDNSVYSSDFISAFYNILKENILNEDKSIIDTLTIADKAFIGIALRNQISNILSIKFSDDEKEDVFLDSIISKFKSYTVPKPETIQIENDTAKISVIISLPTIDEELLYEKLVYKDIKNIDQIKSTKEIQSLISEAFIGETSKYIKNISVNDASFNFNNLSLNEKLRIVEKLPSGLIQKILIKISQWKKDIDTILTVNNKDNTKNKVVNVDSLLFLS